jgi:hypothetical protein
MTRGPKRSKWAGWPLLVVMTTLFGAAAWRVSNAGLDTITSALAAAFLVLTGVLIATEVHETYHQLDGDTRRTSTEDEDDSSD